MAKVKPAHHKWAQFDWNWRFGDQNNVLWSKTLSLFERGCFFLEIDKTCPKSFLQSIFFISSTTMAKVKPAHHKWAQFDWNWRFGDQNNVRWSKTLSLFERGCFFLEIDKTCPKSFLQSIFFISSTTMAKVKPAHHKWAQFDWNWRFGDQNNVRWSKTLSLFERGCFFLEIDKTCPKSFVQSIFFISSTTMAKVKPAHHKWAQLDWNWRFGDQNNVRWSKTLSLFERGCFLLEIDKTCPKSFIQSIFFISSTTMAKVEPSHKKWAQLDWNGRFGDQNKVRWSKNLSLIEREYFFLEIDRTCQKSVIQSIFFILSKTMAKVERAHKKLAQFDWNWWFGDQNIVQWSKTLSLIERVYFFLEIDRTCQKSFIQSIFLFYPKLWLKWSLPTKN